MGASGAILGAAGGVAKTVLGAIQASKAKKAIDSYQRQELTNSFNSVSVSTLGADLQREQNNIATATGISALRQSGVRGLVGGIGSIHQNNINQSRQIGADLDLQQQRINELRANDQTRIQSMQERREEADLAGLGQQLSVGQQNIFSGIGDVAQGISSFANTQKANNNQFVGQTPQVQPVGSSLQSVGNTPIPFGGIPPQNPFK